MNRADSFRFGSAPVYNPQFLNRDEALAQFHARKPAYESLLALLREERPSHVLIIGTRGMGKTTLLQRVRYGVEDDPELSARYLALVFPEEQYNVNHLHHFLLNAVDALADAMERLGNDEMVERVEAFTEAMSGLRPEEIEERVPQFLTRTCHELGRSLLLLVDNADRLFDTIESKDQWQLRELLSTKGELTFIGATAQASEGIYGSDRAFFEFFQIQKLTPLSFEEVRDLLLRLSESVEEEAGQKGAAKRRMEEWLAADAARLRTLVQLTGGNPRTTVLLFRLVLDGLAGGAREYLEQLLDQCTPNYKGRVDDLPPQAQQVLDAVALRWDPATAAEVAKDTGLDTTTVSAQLTRLVRQGLLEKADLGDSKRALYQVAERFFNIWYLMRASRRVRAKLRWFVEFLRVFFEAAELERIAWERLEQYRGSAPRSIDEIENAAAYYIASGAGREKLEAYLRKMCAEREEEWGPYVEMLPPKTARDLEAEGLRSAYKWLRTGDDLAEIEDSEQEAEAAYRTAIAIMPEFDHGWSHLGRLLAKIPERRLEAEAAFRKAVEIDPNLTWAWMDLGLLLEELPGRREEAELAYQAATRADDSYEWAWYCLGDLLAKIPERRTEAELAFRKAIEIDPKFIWAWDGVGGLLAQTADRRVEAEAAYRTVVEIEADFEWGWFHLADLLAAIPGRWNEAEAAYRRASELRADSAPFWASLGRLLRRMPGRLVEAEAAFKRAVEIDAGLAKAWQSLGEVLVESYGRSEEAKEALRKSAELNPGFRREVGLELYFEFGRKDDGEMFLRTELTSRGDDAVLAAILIVAADTIDSVHLQIVLNASRHSEFWNGLQFVSEKYPGSLTTIVQICELVLEHDGENRFAQLYRAVALARLGDFPRASVAFEDALHGDPIDQLDVGVLAIDLFLRAAVRHDRVSDCIEIIKKKEWIDAWRPIYEALQAVAAGSAEYLKRVAVEIREPATQILRRIAPDLSGVGRDSSPP